MWVTWLSKLAQAATAEVLGQCSGAFRKRERKALAGRLAVTLDHRWLRSVHTIRARPALPATGFGHRGGYSAQAVHNYHSAGSAYGEDPAVTDRGRRGTSASQPLVTQQVPRQVTAV